jgi:iron complex transport system substrate-binding protein
MRIVSLLPSLTELVCALGRGADLVGVTHECDYPPGVEELPHLTRSRIPTSSTSAEIDALVAEQGGQLYDLDVHLLTQLRPDVILTQAQCDVCAVSERTVRSAAGNLPGCPIVESVNPTTLAEIHAMFRRVGDLVGAREAADAILRCFTSTAAEISDRLRGRDVVRVLHLEWLDPPFVSGHWNPELITLAGGEDVLGRAGIASRRATWDEVIAAQPHVVLVAPCGFSLERTRLELPALEAHGAWRSLAAVRAGRVAIVDGSAYFSRPGPRIEESLRIAAAVIHPDMCADLAPPSGWQCPVRLDRAPHTFENAGQ